MFLILNLKKNIVYEYALCEGKILSEWRGMIEMHNIYPLNGEKKVEKVREK